MIVTEPPFLVAMNLTRRCNLACEHCYLDAVTRSDGASGELTTEVSAAIPPAGDHVLVCGGDAMMNA